MLCSVLLLCLFLYNLQCITMWHETGHPGIMVLVTATLANGKADTCNNPKSLEDLSLTNYINFPHV